MRSNLDRQSNSQARNFDDGMGACFNVVNYGKVDKMRRQASKRDTDRITSVIRKSMLIHRIAQCLSFGSCSCSGLFVWAFFGLQSFIRPKKIRNR